MAVTLYGPGGVSSGSVSLYGPTPPSFVPTWAWIAEQLNGLIASTVSSSEVDQIVVVAALPPESQQAERTLYVVLPS